MNNKGFGVKIFAYFAKYGVLALLGILVICLILLLVVNKKVASPPKGLTTNVSYASLCAWSRACLSAAIASVRVRPLQYVHCRG